MVMEPPASFTWGGSAEVEGSPAPLPHPRSIPIHTHPQETKEHKLVDAKQCHLQQGHEQQLGWPGLAQHGTEGDEHSPRAEVGIDHAGGLGQVE